MAVKKRNKHKYYYVQYGSGGNKEDDDLLKVYAETYLEATRKTMKHIGNWYYVSRVFTPKDAKYFWGGFLNSCKIIR